MGLNRRAFIQAGLGGSLGLLFTPAPWKLADDVSIWTQNWFWIPRLKYGAVETVPAISKLCPGGCAVQVQTVKGVPFGTEGDEDSALSGGGICPVCANAVQMMNNGPLRVKGPLKKSGEGFEALTWDEAEKLVADQVGGAGSSVAVISGDDTGTVNEVLSGFTAELGGSFYQMPSALGAATKAWNGLMGGDGQIGYDMANSDFVLLIGAEAFESFGTHVAYQKAFADSHPTGEEETAKYVFAGPYKSHTGSVCDQWVPVKPEGMKAFALGLAYYLIQDGASVESADFGDLRIMLANKYTPDQVAKMAGVDKGVLMELAKGLRSAASPVVVADYAGSAATTAAGVLLNLLLGRLNAEGGMAALADAPTVVGSALDRVGRFEKDLVGEVAKAAFAPKVCFTYAANPVFSVPGSLDKVGFKVALATYMDETAEAADLILPAPHCFEQYEDMANPFGVAETTYVSAEPVAKPFLNVKPTGDFMLGLADRLGLGLGFETMAEVIEEKADVAEDGGTTGSYSVSLAVNALGAPVKAGSGDLALAPFNYLSFGGPNVAMTPHIPTAVTDTQLVGKDIVVKANGETAKALGFKNGDKVKLSGGGGEVSALLYVDEAVMTGCVAAPVGFGHTAGDEFSKGKGGNVYTILTASAEAGSYGYAGSAVSVAK